MGEVIALGKKMSLLRRRCKRLTEEQRRAIANLQQFVSVLDRELQQQLDVIGDDTATNEEKDEAFAAIPLIEVIMHERLVSVKRLRAELLGPTT